MENAVYLEKHAAPDELVGRVGEDGKVYAIDPKSKGLSLSHEPDQYLGRVNLENGKVYDARKVPEKYIGRVDRYGKVYAAKLGPDEYLGKISENGRMTYHIPLKRDPYLGKVNDMTSLAHGGAAYLLLILPILEQEMVEDKE